MKSWVPFPAEGWAATAAILESTHMPWPEAAAVMDLRWWVDQKGQPPGRPTLVQRWGWTDWQVRNLLRTTDLWWDPTKGVAPAPTSKPPAATTLPPAMERADLPFQYVSASVHPDPIQPPPETLHTREVGSTPSPSPSPSPDNKTMVPDQQLDKQLAGKYPKTLPAPLYREVMLVTDAYRSAWGKLPTTPESKAILATLKSAPWGNETCDILCRYVHWLATSNDPKPVYLREGGYARSITPWRAVNLEPYVELMLVPPRKGVAKGGDYQRRADDVLPMLPEVPDDLPF